MARKDGKVKLTVTLPDGKAATRMTARAYTHAVVGRMTPASYATSAADERSTSAMYLEAAVKDDERQAGTREPDIRPIWRGSSTGRDFDIECHKRWLAEGKYAKFARNSREYSAKHLAAAEMFDDLAKAGTYGDWGVLSFHSSRELCKVEKHIIRLQYEVRIIEVDAPEGKE